jgi:hypothetical protein
VSLLGGKRRALAGQTDRCSHTRAHTLSPSTTTTHVERDSPCLLLARVPSGGVSASVCDPTSASKTIKLAEGQIQTLDRRVPSCLLHRRRKSNALVPPDLPNSDAGLFVCVKSTAAPRQQRPLPSTRRTTDGWARPRLREPPAPLGCAASSSSLLLFRRGVRRGRPWAQVHDGDLARSVEAPTPAMSAPLFFLSNRYGGNDEGLGWIGQRPLRTAALWWGRDDPPIGKACQAP